jgi:hypothetical protein
MKILRQGVALLLSVAMARADDSLFDRIEQALTFSAAETQLRARISGTLELEGYDFQTPPPGVIDAPGRRLFNPRLSVFVDAQFGPTLYGFVQVRADRGFDPRAADAEVRLDEYALRYTPWRRGILNVQIGRFATVVGNWTNRHGGWVNPFITAPLPYEYLTGIWDTEAIRSPNTLFQWSRVRPGQPDAVTAIEKTLRIPIVWGPAYVPGLAVSGDVGRFRYAVEAKLGSLSSRPEAWDHGREQRHHPAFGARLGYRPSQMWDLGFSASTGSYLREFAGATVAARTGRGDYRQTVFAHDLAFAWRHWQVWGEIYASRFEIPNVGDADTGAYYVEAKYKLTPRLSGALRWNQQLFGRINDRRGVPTKWGHDVWRVDFAPGFRFTPHTQLKFQYSLQRGDSDTRDHTRLLALQFVVRF